MNESKYRIVGVLPKYGTCESLIEDKVLIIRLDVRGEHTFHCW